MRRECERIGRDAAEIEITAPLPDRDQATVTRYTKLGVSRFVMPPPGFDRKSVDAGLAELQSALLGKR